jgi:hypothetical protein
MTEDNLSLGNIEGGDDSTVSYIVPNFMPAAQDIMNWFPCPEVALSIKTRAFCKTFGTSLHLVEKLWFLLNQEELQPVSSCPEHLLWALHFMKVYPKQASRCAAVGAFSRAINQKTHRKWVWAYIEAIAKLVDKVVSIFILFSYLSLQYDLCRMCPLSQPLSLLLSLPTLTPPPSSS